MGSAEQDGSRASFKAQRGYRASCIPAFLIRSAGELIVHSVIQAAAIAEVIVSSGTIAKCSAPFSS
jgi:hypothetical protein